ncbi:MAG: helix-turn-helix domain-containing protein [Dehalococcoidia bacterium]
MPSPRPAYHPTFGSAEVAALERLVRKPTLAHRLVQRAKLALLLHRQPAIASVAAARQLGQHPNWVRTWRKRWATAGFSVAALADQPRSGRPPTVSPPGPGHGQGDRL